MFTDVTIHLQAEDPTPIGRADDSVIGGTVVLKLPGLTMYGPPAKLRQYLAAGIDALSDGTVRWDADGAHVVALRGGNDAA